MQTSGGGVEENPENITNWIYFPYVLLTNNKIHCWSRESLFFFVRSQTKHCLKSVSPVFFFLIYAARYLLYYVTVLSSTLSNASLFLQTILISFYIYTLFICQVFSPDFEEKSFWRRKAKTTRSKFLTYTHLIFS